MITLLALTAAGATCFDHGVGGTFTSLCAPLLAGTLHLFPDFMPNARRADFLPHISDRTVAETHYKRAEKGVLS